MSPRRRHLDYAEIIPKFKTKSPVWEYFGLPADENGQRISDDVAVCRICKGTVCSKGGSTTNLLTHLKVYHPAQHAKIIPVPIKSLFIEEVSNISGNIFALEYFDSNKMKEESPSAEQGTQSDCQPPSSHSEKKIIKLANSSGQSCLEYVQIVPKKRTKSFVWKHFGLPANEDGQTVSETVAICKICENSVCSKGGGTSNMLAHLKVHHPKAYAARNSTKEVFGLPVEEVSNNESNSALEAAASEILIEEPPLKKQKVQNSTSTKDFTSKLELDDFQQSSSYSEKQCTDAITKFIATTMQPYHIVETQSFIKMIKTLNPLYTLPECDFFSKTAIPNLYNKIKDSIQKDLALIKSSDVSITTDCWTSIPNTPFIAVTAHCIDDEWDLKSICLSCVHLEEDHAADDIIEILEDILSSWNLNINEICCCTTDDDASVLKAASLLEVQHVPCFGHTLNTGIHRALEIPTLRNTVGKLKKLQSAVSHNWKINQDLGKIQNLLEGEEIDLPSTCSTGCWGILKLCNIFLENQVLICQLLHDNPSMKHFVLEKSEISSLEDLILNTKLMEDIMKNISEEDHTTASSILPLLTKLKRNLQIKEIDSELSKSIKSEILIALSERYYNNAEVMHTLQLCTLCDPRFRLNYVEKCHEIREFALSYLTKMYDAENDMLNVVNTEQRHQEKSKKGLAKLFEDEDQVKQEVLLPYEKVEIELNNYLAMPKVDLDENPLIWWKSHENTYPVLKKLAKRFLAIQATSILSERVFSAGNDIININKASLLPENAEMKIFLAENKSYI